MAIFKLTDRMIRQTRIPGIYADGGGLYLQVTTGRAGDVCKSWFVRLRFPGGRSRDMGLGVVAEVSLAVARERAGAARKLAKAGTDPIAERARAAAEAAAAIARLMTFRQCAEAYMAAHQPAWKNEKHIGQWHSTMRTYAYPVFGDTPVEAVSVGMVMKALDPIWQTKTETASRLRGRIEAILDWATVRGFRSGDNPARWRGHIEHLLPAPGKARKRGQHAALPFTEIATFMVALRNMEGAAARALEFLILTATRTSETIGARWDEIDLANRTWTIPPSRMKAGREHRIPLSAAALKLLQATPEKDRSGYVFRQEGKEAPLSNMALLMLLRRMRRNDLTAHGFRSTFRDWAAETTDVANEVAEAALAHTISNKVEAAYRRGDLFEKRRGLMDAWGAYTSEVAVASRTV